MDDMIKLGNYVPTMYVTSKVEKDAPKMKINEADFNPKLHAKIEADAPVDPKPKAEPKSKPK